ncbi:metal ABC transporter permease [Thermoflavimicrobium dichotomicum]|uniref:Manganese transport system membrane protein MntC n=1 Tax=Thermoflavimicrobium dichotomicum TaxID=46223 RepID=A0A1I3QF12_9BACL|nr:metal ABC transporter permease [Thermoflavimicrobium dichotomicum]SFJ32129.1 manganese/zinc/iron transport system permease protein [Thermoflavimicrobium dichotomicum]
MDANTWWVLIGTALLGLSSGVLGCFAFLRKQGLMGDVLAHAALPGICLAFMITGAKNSFLFLIGAAITGILGSLCINWITRYSRIKEDTALGLILSVFFGLGIVLLTQIQHSNNGNQSGLDKFLFGQSASMVASDVQWMAIMAGLLLLMSFLLFKELKLLCFDASYGQSLGFSMRGLNLLFMTFLVIVVVIGLQVAGVVLMAALIVTPAAAARYWTEQLSTMVWISAVMGACSGVIGTWISSFGYNLSTGPLIVLAATMMFIISMMVAPQRGLLSRLVRLMKTRRELAREQHINSIYTYMEKEQVLKVSLLDLQTQYPISTHVLSQLKEEGLIHMEEDHQDIWIGFTETGWKAAYDTVLTNRMLEMWLMHEADLASKLPNGEIVSKDSIPEHLVPELQKLMIQHQCEPKWNPYDSNQRMKERVVSP